MIDSWLLLIYTVPAQPSRKRAAVWRDVKRAGAIYLRDGVCALPERPLHLAAFEAIVAKIQEFGGQATLVRAARLDGERAEALVAESAASRTREYDDILREAGRFQAHLGRERDHREFTFGELQELEADLDKLRRWAGQVRDRDFAGLEQASEVDMALAACEAELTSFAEETYEREERGL
jgi:hypothetical protein